jgi:hypothetical protein
MYNSVYRTMIEDNEARKFIDTFVGPSVTMASILRIARNATFALITRIALGLFLPLTRYRTILTYQNFTFTVLKNTVFNELYLHQRIWRHIFENGCGIMGLSTYYIMFRYKKAYLDPPPEKKKEEKNKDGKTTPAPKGEAPSTTKKPGYKRKDDYSSSSYNTKATNYDYEDSYNPQGYNNNNNNNDTPLYGYVPIDEKNDAFYGYREPVYGNEESEYNYNQPSYPVNGYNNAPTYNFAAPSYNVYPDEPPQVENKFLSSFKSILSTLNPGATSGGDWPPVVHKSP